MRKKNIVICDQDLFYAENLAAYMNTSENRRFEAHAFSSWQQAEKAMGEEAVEILLTGRLCAPDGHPARVRYMVILAGDEEPLQEEQTGQQEIPLVYKYQAAPRLLGQVMELCAGPEHVPGRYELSGAGSAAKWIAVISPVGRCGKTAFSVALGKKLARRERTLYINLEDFTGFTRKREDIPKGDLSDLLLYHRRTEGDLSLKMSSLVGRWEDLWYVPPADSFCDIQDAKEEEWLRLLETISAAGMYDTIILDMGVLPKEALGILNQCRRIYIPGLDDPVSREKLHNFRQILQASSPHMEEKVVSLRLPMVTEAMLQQFPDNVCRGMMESFVEKLLAWEKEKETVEQEHG